ncbi:hypothetical protein [Lysobacter sp. CA199]|uniref:hypothetical protein n=1 Tax=Lysobacter sp. CA199 TaxID=3455608 RepID=UPI003F8D11A3
MNNPAHRFYREAGATDARDAEISMLRDALDHIARTAHQSRSQTVRIRWIEARANGALEGKPYVRGQFRDLGEPRNGLAQFEKMQAEIRRMKAAEPIASPTNAEHWAVVTLREMGYSYSDGYWTKPAADAHAPAVGYGRAEELARLRDNPKAGAMIFGECLPGANVPVFTASPALAAREADAHG